MPDTLNPVSWYKGATDVFTPRAVPEIASPRPAKGDVAVQAEGERKPTKGLVPDRSNSTYTEPVRREPAPTKPLAKRAPPAAEPQAAQVPEAKAPEAKAPEAKTTPAVPPPPAVRTEALAPAPAPAAQLAQAGPAEGGKGSYQPSLDRRLPSARDDGPKAPPAVAPDGPPAKPNIPEVVPAPSQKPVRRGVNDYYQRRLAESAGTVDTAGVVEPLTPAAAPSLPAYSASPAYAPTPGYAPTPTYAPTPAHAPALSLDEAPRLIPPKGVRGEGRSGARGLVVPPPAPANSFEVASMSFGGVGTNLSATDRKAIAEVARLYRQTGGIVRVVGRAPGAHPGAAAAVSMERANAVAEALSRLGVPMSKLYVATDTSSMTAMDGSGAQVFIDY